MFIYNIKYMFLCNFIIYKINLKYIYMLFYNYINLKRSSSFIIIEYYYFNNFRHYIIQKYNTQLIFYNSSRVLLLCNKNDFIKIM